VKFYEKNRSKGLVIIGIHCQSVPKEKVLALCRANKVNFSIYGSGKIKGCDFKGIPKVFAFNWKGEIFFDDRLAGMEDAVEVELKSAPDWLVGPRKYVACKSEAGKILRRKGMGRATAALRKKAQSADPAENAEAEELLGRIETYAAREMKKAETFIAEGNPLGAKAIWKILGKEFKGDEIGKKAADQGKTMSKDPSFKKELAAAKIFASMEAMGDRIKPQRRGEDLSKWRRKNGAALGRIRGAFSALSKKYADTKVYARAEAFVKAVNGG
jgi:hypothetical protein